MYFTVPTFGFLCGICDVKMEKEKRKRGHAKQCGVPMCPSTTHTTPKKMFLSVPKNAKIRNQWFSAANKSLSRVKVTTTLYFCEDHFDLPSTVSNLDSVLNLGTRVTYKEGALPTKFECQNVKPVLILRAERPVSHARYSHYEEVEEIKDPLIKIETEISAVYSPSDSFTSNPCHSDDEVNEILYPLCKIEPMEMKDPLSRPETELSALYSTSDQFTSNLCHSYDEVNEIHSPLCKRESIEIKDPLGTSET